MCVCMYDYVYIYAYYSFLVYIVLHGQHPHFCGTLAALQARTCIYSIDSSLLNRREQVEVQILAS